MRPTVLLTLFHPGYFVPCSTGEGGGALRLPVVLAKLDKLETSNIA